MLITQNFNRWRYYEDISLKTQKLLQCVVALASLLLPFAGSIVSWISSVYHSIRNFQDWL